MRLLVQKFGGTSLSTALARERVVSHIKRALAADYQLVVVVSAMGRKGDPYSTDTLLSVVMQDGCHLPAREKDMLLYCGEMIAAATLCNALIANGISSVVLNGAQAGIITDEQHGDAQIITVEPSRINEQLAIGNVVVVTGFQGRSAHNEITTLGRGGSDTSAAALGVALKAECVDIFTDVDGVLTADPRIVEDARHLTHVSYAEICNLAQNGAKVVHPRAAQIAMQGNIPLRVRSTFSDHEGTLITSENPSTASGTVVDRHVVGIAHVPEVAQIRINVEHMQYDLHLQVFKAMAKNHISVDLINVSPFGVTFTILDSLAETAEKILVQMGYVPLLTRHCAKVSIIGGGMNGVPGIMVQIVEALTSRDIQILQSADSTSTISVLVQQHHMVEAIRSLHDKFVL